MTIKHSFLSGEADPKLSPFSPEPEKRPVVRSLFIDPSTFKWMEREGPDPLLLGSTRYHVMHAKITITKACAYSNLTAKKNERSKIGDILGMTT
jgi:hypothetical protein